MRHYENERVLSLSLPVLIRPRARQNELPGAEIPGWPDSISKIGQRWLFCNRLHLPEAVTPGKLLSGQKQLARIQSTALLGC